MGSSPQEFLVGPAELDLIEASFPAWEGIEGQTRSLLVSKLRNIPCKRFL